MAQCVMDVLIGVAIGLSLGLLVSTYFFPETMGYTYKYLSGTATKLVPTNPIPASADPKPKATTLEVIASEQEMPDLPTSGMTGYAVPNLEIYGSTEPLLDDPVPAMPAAMKPVAPLRKRRYAYLQNE